jgi:hypothetical protein
MNVPFSRSESLSTRKDECPPFPKEWGISAEQIEEWRTLTKDVKFKPTGQHGGEFSTTFHNKIFEIADKAPDFATYKRELAKLAEEYLEGGAAALPIGLRP